MNERPRLVAVCLRDPEGMSASACSQLQRVIDARAPAWSAFLNPYSFVVLFTADAGGQSSARGLIEEVSRLATDNTTLRRVRIGRAEGDAIATYGDDGKLSNMPLGAFINDALVQAAAV